LAYLRQGREDAFQEIFKTYWCRLYTIAYSKLQSREEAEEIVQGIFVNLWEKRETLLITNLSFYLQKAVTNRVINQIRSKITQRKYWQHYQQYMPLQREGTDDLAICNDLEHVVEEVVNRLPKKSREVFRLSRVEGQSVAEIANRLNLSEKAIEYHISKSLKELRVHLKNFLL
jgi:RNA polymerase sigma-70 factor (ECF subfamily)